MDAGASEERDAPMTDQTVDRDEEDDGAADGDGQARGWSGKRLVLFIGAPVVLLLAIGGALLMTPMGGALFGKTEVDQATAEKEAEQRARTRAVFFDLPDILVNLNVSGGRSSFLKVSISLELSGATDVQILEQMMPRIVDNFQVYLRELRVDDLRGSAGMYRLREDLLRRVNEVSRPVVVRDVLFREVLVQ